MKIILLNFFQNKIDVMRAYKFDQYLKSVRTSESYEFISANRVYVDTNLPVRECMLKFFQDEIEKLVRNQPQKYNNDF